MNSICSKSKKLTCYTVNFYLKDIEPMVWNDKAYEHLLYDPQQKELVLSFVESHGRASTLDRYVMTLERMESGVKITNPQAGKSPVAQRMTTAVCMSERCATARV